MPQNAKFSSRICQSALGKFVNLALSGPATTYNGLVTAAQGLPPIIESVSLAAQAAAIAATPLLTGSTTTAGLYRISYYHVTSAVDATSGDSQLTLTWNDGSAAQSLAVTALTDVLGNYQQGSVIVELAASENIDYAVSYASNTAGDYKFGLNITLERLQ